MSTLFGEPTEPPRRLPAGATRDSKAVRYLAYTGRADCADCVQVSYEAGMKAVHAPSIRAARFRRIEGKQEILLCAGHKHERQITPRG